jgi:hypothetical protein
MKSASIVALIAISCLFVSCASKKLEVTNSNEYHHNVGDISFNPTLDNADFGFCDSTKIRSGRTAISLKEGNVAIRSYCLENFENQAQFESFSGFVTIRFLVNCKLEADRFRAHSMDYNFAPQACPAALKSHLTHLVSQLENWTLTADRYTQTDFSKFINFKIKDGTIEKIIF